MKICFVGSASSLHIVKWCKWFSDNGHKVIVISFMEGDIENVHTYTILRNIKPDRSDFHKIGYLFTGKAIRKIIEKEQPDIINAHYATSYGTAMALSGIKNYIVSVWGSDVYNFPKKSLFHKAILKFSLWKAQYLFSTSFAMAKEAAIYTRKKFEITPFGVDMELFNSKKRTRLRSDYPHPFVIGTIKSLETLYGIDFLLKAVAMIKHGRPELDIELRIAGSGSKAEEYIELSKKLKIDNITTFLGEITQEQAAEEWANMDIAVIPPILYESFGVSAIEAQACETPIIISDVEGMLETTMPAISSKVVPKKNSQAIADAIIELYYDPETRRSMGKYGREYVEKKYELNKCFEDILKRYNKLLIKETDKKGKIK